MKTTAFNKIHNDLGARMVTFAGYEMPVQYSGVKSEHMAVRNSVGVFDVSHMGQFRFKGSGAEACLQNLITNDVTTLVPGKAQYACLTNKEGGIIDDLILYKISNDNFLMVVNAGCLDKDWEWVNNNKSEDCEIINESDDTSLLAIQGPKAIDAMQSLTSVDLSEIKFYHFEIAEFAGAKDVMISATGYTGSGGFEIYFPNEFADQIWEAVMDAGKEYNIEPCGLAARDTLRLEKGYCLYGNDIDENTTPLNAGLGWVTKLKTNFIGADKIKAQKKEGIDKKLVGFVIEGKGIARHGYEIVDANGETIGEVTSGTQSPILGKGIGLGYVNVAESKVNNTIYIKVRNKTIEAKVTKLPFV